MDPDRAEQERIVALQTRRENAEKRRQLVTRKMEHKVPEEQKVRPKFGGHDRSRLGDCRMTDEYEFVPAARRETLSPGLVGPQLRRRCARDPAACGRVPPRGGGRRG